jgi:hypothetical protein
MSMTIETTCHLCAETGRMLAHQKRWEEMRNAARHRRGPAPASVRILLDQKLSMSTRKRAFPDFFILGVTPATPMGM